MEEYYIKRGQLNNLDTKTYGIQTLKNQELGDIRTVLCENFQTFTYHRQIDRSTILKILLLI